LGAAGEYALHPPADPQRFGRIGWVPWTLRQTAIGAAITLVPWVTFIVAAQLAAPKSGQPLRPLSPAADALGALGALISTVIVEGAFLLVPLYYAVWRPAPGVSRREGLRALGFRAMPLRPALGWVIGGLAVVIVGSIIYSALVQTFHLPLQTNADELAQQAHYMPLTVLALLIGAVVVAPICEEIFFRGFLFSGLLHGMALWPAVLLSSLLFGIAHGQVGSFVPLVIIGMVLAVVRWYTGSIWPGFAIHMGNNAIAAIGIIVLLIH
jgi:membrane protease YdiL (CAAX protease family)